MKIKISSQLFKIQIMNYLYLIPNRSDNSDRKSEDFALLEISCQIRHDII